MVAQKVGHRLLDEFVVDRLFGLVFIRCLGRQRRRYQNQAILHILETDLAFVFEIPPVLLQVSVDLRHKRRPHRFFGRTAMFQPAGVVIILLHIPAIGKAQRHIQLHFVFRLVCAVAPAPLRRPHLHTGQRIVARHLLHIVGDAVFIDKFLRIKAAPVLRAQHKQQIGVDDRLPFQNILIIFQRHGNVGEHLQIRFPTDGGAGILFGVRLLVQPANVFALFKMQGIFIPVAAHLHIHIFRRILGSAGTKAVQAQRKLIVFARIGVVFTACIQLTKHQFPVEPLLFFVEIHRHTAAKILYFDRTVLVTGGHNALAVSLARLVNGVGQYLKHRVFAALQPIRAKNNRRAFAHPGSALQHFDAVVSIFLLFGCHVVPSFMSSKICQ